MTPNAANGLIDISVADRIMQIALNRPDKKNALSNAMYGALTAALHQATEDAAIRAVLITSTSGDFTSGNDLGDFAAFAVQAAAGAPPPLAAMDFIRALAQFPKPLIAAVPGLAVGVGMTMLLHCDAAIVETSTRLSAPFVRLALSPEAASSVMLQQRLGHQRALAVFAGLEVISGAEAVRTGLALHCVPDGQSTDAARKAALALAALPPAALRETKRLMRDTGAIGRVIEAEAQLFVQRLQSGEAAEALRAFAEKRAPDYTRF